MFPLLEEWCIMPTYFCISKEAGAELCYWVIGPGVQFYQYKHSSQSPISYALPSHVSLGYWSLLLLCFADQF